MGRPKIMLVDDDALFLLAHREELEAAGYEVSTALSGEEAIFLAGEEHPDIVFVDLIMPGMNGVEVCRGILRISPRTDVMLISGCPGDRDPRFQEFLNAGGRPGQLSKPLREYELTRTIDEILAEKGEKKN